MKRQKFRHWLRDLHLELRNKKKVAAIYIVLRALVIGTMVAQFFNGNYENVFLCLLTLVLFLIPTLVERRLKIDLPNAMEIVILCFIFAAEILGEIQAFYTTFQGWDTILHTLNGFLCAAIGFSLVDMFNRTERFSLSLSPIFLTIVAFCFSMTIGVLWEFFEFAVDQILLFDMQKDTWITRFTTVSLDPENLNRMIQVNDITKVVITAGGEELVLDSYLDVGLIDTMKDLLVNFIGAIVFSVGGFFYAKNRDGKRGRFVTRFIPRVLTEQEDGQEPSE